MATIFDKIRAEAGSRDLSLAWYRKQVNALASRISAGRLMREGKLRSTPKINTLNLLNKQEKENRNIYTGSFGYIKFNGDMRFNIIIRSILNFKNFSEISVASGVVVDSNAINEFNENYIKAKALIDLFK